MAKNEIEDKVGAFVDETDGKEKKIEGESEEYQPQYRMMTDQAIPISKNHGKLWRSRRDTASAKIKNGGDGDRWDACLRYYRNDQSERVDDEDYVERSTSTTTGVETENIVFANTSALVPAIYAKNPSVEMTFDMEDTEDFVECLEKLVNVLIRKKSYPGVNLKPHARRAVLMTTLTNIAYIEVGWTDKEESSEETLRQITIIGQKMKKAKRDELESLEGELLALEATVDVLHGAGAWVKFRRPGDVLIDPDTTEHDDSQWMMICEYLPTSFIKAKYGKKNEDDEYMSVYKPTHVLKVDADGIDGLDNGSVPLSLFDTSGEKSGRDYGYEDDSAYEAAQRTKCWYVWDKATRRVYLYADNDWKWPLWVWDDPYGYDNFYPLVPLQFYTDPTELYARSEVVMYLDQQDAINKINNEVAKVRDYAVGKVVYNTNVIKDEALIEAFIDGTGGRRALGVNVPPEVDLTKAFSPLLPQSAHVLQSVMFDKQRLLESINRVSSVTDSMRNVEFKTNTTNKAIEVYTSNTQTRLDEKVDAVEDFIGAIGWKIAQLCISKLESQEVAALIGERFAEVWDQRPDYEVFKTVGSCQCVGGSTLKPTSATKKEQAIQIGQVLGQFANVTPVTFLVALKVMERAFDDVIISDKEWSMIEGAIKQALAQQQQQGQPQENEDVKGHEELINRLPEEAKAKLAEMVKGGIPIRKALETIVKELDNKVSGGAPEEEEGGPPMPNGAEPPQPPQGAMQ